MGNKKTFLKDKVVLITGGSSGIGKQLAIDCEARGAIVIVCSNNVIQIQLFQEELRQRKSSIDTQICDIRDTKQIAGLANYCISQYSRMDVLINNAGYAVYRPFEESSVEENLDIIDVNLCGAMRCTKAFLPHMISRRNGVIVNISSIGGEIIITPNASYCAAKHGMLAWSKAIRYELSQFNIAVNVVCPSYVKTNFHDHTSFRRRDPYRNNNARELKIIDVSKNILNAIYNNRVVTYIPKWTYLLVWILNSASFFVRPIWDKILINRIKELYLQMDKEINSNLN